MGTAKQQNTHTVDNEPPLEQCLCPRRIVYAASVWQICRGVVTVFFWLNSSFFLEGNRKQIVATVDMMNSTLSRKILKR